MDNTYLKTVKYSYLIVYIKNILPNYISWLILI